MIRMDEVEVGVEAQCSFVYGLMMDIRTGGGYAALDVVPDADYQRFHLLWERVAWRESSSLNTKQRAFLNRFEAGITRVYHGEPYASTIDPSVQTLPFGESEATR